MLKDMGIKINKGIVSRDIEGNCYIVDSKNQILHNLNQTGTFIFHQIEKNKNKEKILESLSKDFEVDEKKARDDLDEFLEILSKKNIISYE